MKQVVSVSIGSSKRDHSVELELLGETFRISREGYDGDVAAAKRRFQELDGHVDALGMGGIDIYLLIDGKRYYFRASKDLARCTKQTPILDGSGLKGPIEGSTVAYMRDELGLEIADKLVMMPCSVDRWGMAQAFHDAGANVVAGDLIFTVGINKWIRDWENLRRLIRIAAPIIMAIAVPATPELGKNFLPGLMKEPQPMTQPKAIAQTCIGERRRLSVALSLC